MLFKDVFRVIGFFLLSFCLILGVPTTIALFYGYEEQIVIYSFLGTIATTLMLGLICLFLGRKSKGQIFRREGILAVVLIWVITPFLSSLPFIYSQTLDNPVQAYFEMVSGYTTTGSTILQAKKFNEKGEEVPIVRVIPGVIDTKYQFYGTVNPIRDEQGNVLAEGIEAVPKPLLFWRSFIQWLGGMGVIVLFVAILPALGVGGKVLFNSEVPGPVKETLSPRIKEAAIELWKIYVILTVVQIGALLLASNMTLFDAATTTFTTLSTGGLSVKNTSIASYNSELVEWIIIIFMALGSINFSLYYFAFRGKFYRLNDRELWIHLALLLIFSLTISYFILGAPKVDLQGNVQGTYNAQEALRYGIFQSVSGQTSTGFNTINYDLWPYLPQVILLIAMYVGGMSGSTSGGMKTIRLYMLFKIAQNKAESIFRPESIRTLRIGEKEIESKAANLVLVFFSCFIAISTIGVLLFVWDGYDPETAIGLVACMINNTGMTFRAAGPLDSCAVLSNFSLIVSSILMIIGRLEIFAVIALLIPAFWKESS
jgi:trk system potassium uptake protein TrkH